MEAVGGVGGVQGRGAGGGLLAAGGPNRVTGVLLSGPGRAVRGCTVRSGSETNAAQTRRPRLGPWPPPARASTSRTPRSTCGTSSSWTGPRGVSRDSEGGPFASGQKGGVGLGRPQCLQVPQDPYRIFLVGEGWSSKFLSVPPKGSDPFSSRGRAVLPRPSTSLVKVRFLL